MPAKDRHHTVVVHALINAGWQVTGEQVAIILTERRRWVDIGAEKAAENAAILVEVKGFENMLSPIDYLAAAVGKYILYRVALAYLLTPISLYMAVPIQAYHGILSEEIGR